MDKMPSAARFTLVPKQLVGQSIFLALIAACGFAVSWSFSVTCLIAAPTTVVFAALTFASLRLRFGSRLAAVFVLLAGLFGFLVEMIGTQTGFPFGQYYYTDTLGSPIFGVVPTAMAFAWAPMLVGGLYVARRVKGPRLARVASGALAVTALDFVMDPGTARVGYWIWPDGGVWYGVPLSNFVGWFLVSLLGTALAARLIPPGRLPPETLICATVIAAFWGGFALSQGWWMPFFLALFLVAVSLRETAKKPVVSSILG